MDDPVFGDNIKNIVKNVAVSNGLNDYQFTKVGIIEKGQGFASKIFLVTISDKSSETKLNLALKLAYKDETLRQMSSISLFFEQEIYFYSVIYPALEKYRESVGCDQKYNLVPKCYYTLKEPKMESLVLENLKILSFETIDKNLDITSDHFELIFERYGYFHAHSLALKDQNFGKFSELIAPIKNVYHGMLSSKGFITHGKALFLEVNNLLVSEKKDKLINGFKKYLHNFDKVFLECVDDGGKYSTILHGDCWSNNMLFKHDQISRKPVDMRLIDWQMMRAGNPVCDLSCALYADASKLNLDKLYDYLAIYHTSLSSTLRKFGSDPDKILPLDELKDQWKIYAKFGFILGVVVVKTKCIKNIKEFTDFDNTNENVSNSFPAMEYDEDRFKKKILDLVSHMYEVGAL